MTIMREQAKTDTFKAKQYKFYLEKNKITDAYVAAYAAAVSAKFGLGNGGTTGNSGSASTGKNLVLGDVPIKNSGWRYNMTIMREQAKTDTFKAKQYKFYLEKNKITDAYVAAYAAAVRAKFGLGNGGTTGNSGSASTGKNLVLGDVPIKNSGWRYNMTIMREQAKTDTFKAKQYKFYLEKNKITDAYVAAYAAAVSAKFGTGSESEKNTTGEYKNLDDTKNNHTDNYKKRWTIYKGFRYHEMPDLSNCGLDQNIKILYKNQLFGRSSIKIPNISKLKSEVVPYLAKKNFKYVIIDIEHWDPIKEIDKLILVVRTLKQGVLAAGNTYTKFGYYMLLPDSNYLAPNTKKYRPDRWIAWLKHNEQMRQLSAEVDVVFPSLYTVADDQKGWLEYARTNIAEARKYGKPVIPFIWPQYHDYLPDIGTQYLPQSFWRMQLDTLRTITDGVVVWGSVAKTKGWERWRNEMPWWNTTKEFAKKYSNSPYTSSCKH